MKEAVIVSGARTAVGRAPKGTLRGTHPADMAAACITEALNRAEGLDSSEVEDVIIGCAMPEGTQGYNVARQSLLRAGLPETVAGQTVNRFCSSGLQTIAAAAERIMAGFGTTIVAGGVEHMSTTLEMPNFSPNPTLVETNPAVYMGMGLTAEQVAKEFDVSREDQDEFALRSHNFAKEAVESGRFDEEIVPMDVKLDWVDESGEPRHMETTFERDEGPRDTSKEKLAKLPPSSSRTVASPRATPPSAPTGPPRSSSWSARGQRSLASPRSPVSSGSPSAGCARRSWASGRPSPSRRCSSSPGSASTT